MAFGAPPYMPLAPNMAIPPPNAVAVGPSAAAMAWTEHTGPDGRIYYFNTVTGVSSWDKPDELKTRGERILAACQWREHRAADDRPYYYNTVTRETKWEKPEDLIESEKRAAAEDAVLMARTKKEDDSSAIPLPDASNGASDSSDDDDDESSPQQSTEHVADGSPKNSEMVIYSSGKDGVDAFRKFLREKNLASYLSWDQAHTIINNDPRYKQFVNVKQKKQHFLNYKGQKAREERDESRAKINKLKDELEAIMMRYANSPANIAAINAATAAQATAITEKILRSTTSFKKAEEIFGNMEEWRRIDEGTRKQAFENVTRELARKERETAETTRKKALAAFTEMLRSTEQITMQTTWVEAQQLLSGCVELSVLDREDALDCFEEHIRSLEKEYDEEQERERRRTRRQQRKNREAFIVLLEELHEQGRLHSMSLWTELYLTISKDERFHAMLSQAGSTALDLFKFYVEDLKARYHEDKKVIADILSKVGFTVTTSTSFEAFANALAEDKRYLSLDAGNIKQAYNRLTEKALAAEKETLRQEAKQLQKLQSAFQKALRELTDPPVTLESKWPDVRPRIADRPEFAAITEEADREKLFADYLEILEEVCAHRHSKHKHAGGGGGGGGSAKRHKKDRRGGGADDGEEDDDSSPNIRIGPDEYGASKRIKRERSGRDDAPEVLKHSDEEEPMEAGETRESSEAKKESKNSKKEKKRHRHHRKHGSSSRRHGRKKRSSKSPSDKKRKHADGSSEGDGVCEPSQQAEAGDDDIASRDSGESAEEDDDDAQ